MMLINRLFNRLFKGLAVVLTVMGGIVIIGLLVNLVDLTISDSGLEGRSFSRDFNFVLLAKQTQRYLILVLIASPVEIALFWLLVLLDVVSRHRGLIATLVLFIFVGIVVFIVFKQYL
ncbi:hypothetical protein LC612_06015 [Nostoc sp. CHAB 5834]|nr:hypothetical protein [Nostoc sp. CHAB 5834]